MQEKRISLKPSAKNHSTTSSATETVGQTKQSLNVPETDGFTATSLALLQGKASFSNCLFWWASICWTTRIWHCLLLTPFLEVTANWNGASFGNLLSSYTNMTVPVPEGSIGSFLSKMEMSRIQQVNLYQKPGHPSARQDKI